MFFFLIFLAVLCVFPFLTRDFWGSAKRKTLVFFGVFLVLQGSFCRVSGDLAPSTQKALAIVIVRFWYRSHVLFLADHVMWGRTGPPKRRTVSDLITPVCLRGRLLRPQIAPNHPKSPKKRNLSQLPQEFPPNSYKIPRWIPLTSTDFLEFPEFPECPWNFPNSLEVTWNSWESRPLEVGSLCGETQELEGALIRCP